jgi:anti-sigma regulatory factor (Ser/Thr protein kinase)
MKLAGMKRYLICGKKRCTKLILKISPQTPFQDTLARIEKVEFVGSPIPSEHIIYSILELINNSLRAHRNRKEDRPILLKLKTEKRGFEIDLKDWGGGFDVKTLPYSLNEEISKVDIHSEEFETYRQGHNYQRFGLGLYLARKTFDDFSLRFFDAEGKESDWIKGKTVGTRITLRALHKKDKTALKEYPR